VKPRRLPRQARAGATLDVLLTAAAEAFARDGWERANVNAIAKRAGVNIGSLYQYFPSKEALVVAVIERHNFAIMQIVRNALAQVVSLPMEQAVRKLVETAIEAHRMDPKLHRVLAEQIPRTGKLENVEAFNRETYTLFKAYLEAHREEFRPMDLELAAFVCVTSIEALTHNAVLHHSEMLSTEMKGTLIEEATRLIVGYLR
jgi:AcrR family transcriptional regulator